MRDINGFDLTAPQHEPEGQVIHCLFFDGIIARSLKESEWSGCPGNGYFNDFHLHTDRKRALEFFDSIKEIFEQKGGKLATGWAALRHKVATS